MTIKIEGALGGAVGTEGASDVKSLAAVKEILVVFARTISQMKLYPGGHSSVAHFRNLLFEKLSAFLEEAETLEIDIQQNVYLFQGVTVYDDENVIRSLPYLFFKDGMKKLAFFRGIDADELEMFLTTVRETSLLPVDVGDIVDALWQQDLAHIRYVAPDEYLESKVTVKERIPTQFQVKADDLYKGRIDLKPEDVAELFGKMRAADPAAAVKEADYAARFAPLDDNEIQALEATLASQRRIMPDKDFLDLMLELLNIEERPEVLTAIFDLLKKFNQVQLQSLDFVHAAQSLIQVDKVLDASAGKIPEKERAIADFKAALIAAFPEKELLKAACEGRIIDLEPFFLYLTQIGPPSLSLGAEITGHGPNEDIRGRAFSFLQDMGRRSLMALSKLAQAANPEFTRIVVAVFAKLRDPQAIPCLADIVGFEHKPSRLKAIQALGTFPEPAAQKILTGLLDDDDEDIRTQAAAAVRLAGDAPTIGRLIQAAGLKSFHRKSAAEKSAILKALGRSGSSEAAGLLGTLLLKSSLFKGRHVRESRLLAVAALEANGGPEAAEALRSGARRAPRQIKAACRETLAYLKPGPAAGDESSS